MTQFIEKHRRLLQAYCLIARILGWVLLLGGILWLFAIVGNCWQIKEERRQIDFLLYVISSLVYDFVIPGFLAFAIGGLLDYLLRPMKKPPLILGMTDKLCYIYSVFLIFQILPLRALRDGILFVNLRYLTIPDISEQTRILLVQPLIVATLAKILLLIGIGMILNRLLPVIEESKTLV
jgi:hypothetical protein